MNRNFISKLLTIIIFCTLFLLLFTSFASAACCITSGGCQNVSDCVNFCSISPSYCEGANNCSNVAGCVRGCCCLSTTNTGEGMVRRFCDDLGFGYTFVEMTVGAGASCTCTGERYSVSGTITDTIGQPLSGATVSAGGKTNLTNQYGAYSITNVTESANLMVTALKQSCDTNTTYTNLNQDRSGVDMTLNCECTGGACDVENNRVCNYTTSEWNAFNLAIPSQNATYCTFCGDFDWNDCPQEVECVSNDLKCLLGCTPETDSDCACLSGNGVCPPPPYDCGGTDSDCITLTASCGDRLVTYPYETCEPDPLDNQLTRCNPSNCPGPGSPGACSCQVLSDCGNNNMDAGEECEIGMMCSNGVLCNTSCECSGFSCNGTRANPGIGASYGSERITVTWTPVPACLPLVSSYAVYRCENNSENPNNCSNKDYFSRYPDDNPIFPPTANMFDSSISENSQYCYFVQAFYGPPLDGIIGESDIACQKTGNTVCMEPHADEFCLDNTRYRCDADNRLRSIADCGSGHCMGPDADGSTRCESSDVCDNCNGLYGMFANRALDLRVIYADEIYWCLPGLGRETIPGCYLDRTKTLFSAFKYCADITNCYDYKSNASCEDPADPCGKNIGCEWAWMFGDDNNVSPLGGIFGGVCRPILNTSQRCSLCDDTSNYNWLSINCNPASCRLFGDCYYQGASQTYSSAPTCTSMNAFSCRNYNNQQDCTGGTAVVIDAAYNATDGTGVRISGTHSWVKSRDDRDLGKCYWDAINDRCMRNADNYPQGNTYPAGTVTTYGRDCALSDTYCESDFSNPATSILPTTFGAYPANMKIRFSVSDNYPASLVHTYFCLNASATSCYPNELPTAIGEYSKVMTQSGEFDLYYYSQDSAKNLEPVKHLRISVDAERPSMTINDCSVQAGQQNLTISGMTSLDARWACFNNSVRKRVSCINNCALTGQVQPCINNRTGEFIFNITVSDTDFRNITGLVEDFAGNTYYNTLYGICHDIPDIPQANITIKAMGQS